MLSTGQGHSSFHQALHSYWYSTKSKECRSFQQTTQHSQCHYVVLSSARLQKTGHITSTAMLANAAIKYVFRSITKPPFFIPFIYYFYYFLPVTQSRLRFAEAKKVNCLPLYLQTPSITVMSFSFAWSSFHNTQHRCRHGSALVKCVYRMCP